MAWIYFIILSLVIFVGSFLWQINTEKQQVSEPAGLGNSAYISMFSCIVVSAFSVFFTQAPLSDALYIPNLFGIIAPLAGSAAIFVMGYFIHSKLVRLPLVFLIACGCVYTFPANFLLFEGFLPPLADKLSVAVILTIFAANYKLLNGTQGVVLTQSLAVFASVFLLYLFSGISIFYGQISLLCGIICLSALTLSFYPNHLKLRAADCSALGFILGWLLLCCCIEGSPAATLTYSSFYIWELVTSTGKKLLDFGKKEPLVSYSSYIAAEKSGLLNSEICQYLGKSFLIVAFIGTFSIYTPSFWAFPIFGFLIVGFGAHKMQNWQEEKDLKHINQSFKESVKESIQEIKNSISGKDHTK